MARKYRIKKYYRRKGKWSANIKTLTNTPISTTAASTFYSSTVLCTNPAQNDNTVSQQYTVKNTEVSYILEIGQGDEGTVEGLTSYIMFVPQGYNITETLPNTHPEWIMAMRFLGNPESDLQNPGRNAVKIKTRLARRLQTGDSVILLIVGNNTSDRNKNIYFSGIVRWWTKAN